MRMRLIVAVLTAGSVLAALPAAYAKGAEMQAGTAWLSLIDGGKYAESWDTASTVFKDGMSREQWQETMGRARTQLGPVAERALVSGEVRTQLAGAPEGRYFVLQYRTTFEHRAQSLETVTLTMDPDGNWRVVGYSIH